MTLPIYTIHQQTTKLTDMAKPKLKWLTFTSNPQWGRYFIGESDTRSEAIEKGRAAGKGEFVVERRYKWK